MIVKKVRVGLACAIVGAVYGVAGTTIYSLLVMPLLEVPPHEYPRALVEGIITGMVLGGVGGCLAGFIGDTLGGWLGWCFAGTIGGMSSGAALCRFLEGLLEQPLEVFLDSSLTTYLIGVVVLGGSLGVAIGRSLNSGRSRVPGVKHLVVVINDDRRPHRAPRSESVPAELIPARALEGRGDEATPA